MNRSASGGILLFVLICAVFSNDGKIFSGQQGEMWLGGTVGFETSGIHEKGDEDTKNRMNVLTFSPILRFFPASHFSIGPKLTWIGVYTNSTSSSSPDLSYTYKSRINAWGLGGELGFVYGTPAVIPFAFVAPHASIQRSSYSTKSSSPSFPDNEDSEVSIVRLFVLPFTAGVILPVGTHIGIQIEAGYRLGLNKDYNYNTLSIGFGICGLGERVAVSMVNHFLSTYGMY